MAEQATVSEQGVAGRNGGRLSMAGKGRARGVPNKSTRNLKAAALASFNDPRGGAAEEFLIKMKCGSGENQRAYLAFLGRLVPMEIAGQMDSTLVVKIMRADGEHEVRRVIAGKSERVPALGNQPGNELAASED